MELRDAEQESQERAQGYVIDGKKRFVTFGDIAAVYYPDRHPTVRVPVVEVGHDAVLVGEERASRCSSVIHGGAARHRGALLRRDTPELAMGLSA
jgi:hypothetical protein